MGVDYYKILQNPLAPPTSDATIKYKHRFMIKQNPPYTHTHTHKNPKASKPRSTVIKTHPSPHRSATIKTHPATHPLKPPISNPTDQQPLKPTHQSHRSANTTAWIHHHHHLHAVCKPRFKKKKWIVDQVREEKGRLLKRKKEKREQWEKTWFVKHFTWFLNDWLINWVLETRFLGRHYVEKTLH